MGSVKGYRSQQNAVDGQHGSPECGALDVRNQVNSGRKSSPVYGMGTGYHNPHVFVSQDHEKCNYGRLGPGPAHYTSEDSWTKDKSGKKTESTKVSCSSTKFGNASRFYTVRDPRMPSGTP